MENTAVNSYWTRFVQSHPEYGNLPQPMTMGFSQWTNDNTLMGKAIIDGKTRCSYALLQLQHLGLGIPKIGDLKIITDADGNPKALIKTLKCTLHPWFAVPEAHMVQDVLGNGNPEEWRKAHWEGFTAVLHPLQRLPKESMIVVCEHFEVLDKSP